MKDFRCANHPQAAAVAVCAGCGVYLCPECVVEVEGRAHCPGCARAPREMPVAPGAEKGQAGAHAGAGGPVPARVVATCDFHPGARAVARCSRCGALICSACQRKMGEKRFCEHCFNVWSTRTGSTGKGSSKADALYFQETVPWKLWPGLAFLPVPFALSGLMTYMMRQGEEVSVGAAQLLISLLLYSMSIAFAFLVVYPHGHVRERLGMHARNLPLGLGLGTIGGALAFWLATIGGLLSAGVLERVSWIEEWLQGFFDVNVKSVTGPDLLIAGVVIIVAAPVCEEIFFRGLLYPAMRERLGIWGAVFINGFLFSLVHFSLFGLLGRTLAGALFCLLYEYTDNLWSPVAAHALNNFVAFFLPLASIWGS